MIGPQVVLSGEGTEEEEGIYIENSIPLFYGTTKTQEIELQFTIVSKEVLSKEEDVVLPSVV